MKLVGFLNLLFYSILAAAFFDKSSAFDLARHGLEFDWRVVLVAFAHYVLVAVYVVVHKRGKRVLVDAYNMFLLLFSVLIVPGVMASAAINDSIAPHLSFLLSGILFVLVGLAFEVVSPGTTSRAHLVTYRQSLPRSTAATFFTVLLLLLVIVLATGNFNRAGAYHAIAGLFLGGDSTEVGAVASYRSEVYNNWGAKEVIGNYAGNVFGAFFALLLFSHFWALGRQSGRAVFLILAVAVASFPILFALGTGSRLMLLRTILLYIVFMTLPKGLKLLDWRLLQFFALAFAILILSTTILGRGIQGETFEENLVIQTEKSIARLFLGKGGSTMVVYDYYPRVEDFELAVPILERLSGLEIDDEPSVAVKIFAYLTNNKLGTAGPQSFGDLYASFGYVGQLIGSIVIAILLLSIRKFYCRSPNKSSVDRALWAYVVVAVGYTGYSDVGSFRAIGLFYILIGYFLLRLAGDRKRRVLAPGHRQPRFDEPVADGKGTD
ncbi:MAG: oligosaccharide repeat unit polymerase [Fuscovulum sp.]|nr:oligosaccharide repeat unit polymerase [Fuscovulum sp.]